MRIVLCAALLVGALGCANLMGELPPPGTPLSALDPVRCRTEVVMSAGRLQLVKVIRRHGRDSYLVVREGKVVNSFSRLERAVRCYALLAGEAALR